jgi:hypothetical protein
MVFLALLLVTPVLFAGPGNVASSDTVNQWFFWKAEGENQDSTWTYLTDSAIVGKSSQVFGLRSYGRPNKYFWVLKLDKKYKKPSMADFWIYFKSFSSNSDANFLETRIYLGNSERMSDIVYVEGFSKSKYSVGLKTPTGFGTADFTEDSLDVLVFCFNFVLADEKVFSEIVFDEITFIYEDGSLVVIDDGGEPKFPQFKVSTPKINFGLVAKNERKLDSVTVFNTGDAPLQISKIWTSDSVFSAKCSVETIAPQASTNVVVEFVQDSVPGLKRAKLYIEHNGSGELDSIELVADFMTSVGDDKNLSPVEYGLSQNYPNPFNPSTKINYSVKSRQWAKLTVYDLLGKEIAVLVDGEQEVGEHFVIFNAQNLPSGTYIYRLQTGDFTVVKKMLLLK